MIGSLDSCFVQLLRSTCLLRCKFGSSTIQITLHLLTAAATLSQNLRIKKPEVHLPARSLHSTLCFTLRSCFCRLHAASSSSVKKGKARRGKVYAGSMHLTNVSNKTSPSGSGSCPRMPKTNGEKTSRIGLECRTTLSLLHPFF